MSEIKIGVQLHPQHTTFEHYQRTWLQLDEMGVDSIWDWDHFFPIYGDPKGPELEGWTTLSVLGAQTRRAQIGCLVLAMSYRNPALLSKMAATLDLATQGRLILGLGAGWFRRDYDEFGYEFGTAGERLKNLERGIKIIKERWQKDNPKPTGGSIPTLIGGSGEKVTLRITAQYADMWNSFGPVEHYERKNRVLDEWCQKVGRDPAEVERTISFGPDMLDQIDDFVRIGAQHLILNLGAPFDLATVKPLLAWRDRQRDAERADGSAKAATRV